MEVSNETSDPQGWERGGYQCNATRPTGGMINGGGSRGIISVLTIDRYFKPPLKCTQKLKTT